MDKKFKYITISFLMIMAFGLFGCSDEAAPVPGPPMPPSPVEDGYSSLTISIRNDQKTQTYAPGLLEAYPQEKEIRSIAFFTETDDVGKFGEPGFLPGAFNAYFSTEELRSVNGLYEPLEGSNGSYTVGLRIKSEGFGTNTRVIVVANYDENGLTPILKNVRNWEELKYILTPEIEGEHLHTPLVMFGSASVPLTNGGTESATIQLFRVVSRLDVINEAAVPAEPEKGFVLHSAQVLHPKKFGFLLPGNSLSTEIPTLASLPEVEAANLPESDPTKITGLYMYETDNSGTKSEKTRILVKGLLFDTPFEREIALKKPDEPGKDGEPIALLRNHLYRLVITGVVGTDIDWNVQIADWNDGSNIDVLPSLAKPLLTNISFENGAEAARWNEATHTYTYDGKNPEVIRFTAVGSHATTYGFHCELEGRGESIGLHNPDHLNRQRLFKREEPVLSYATVSQTYEITLPTVLQPDVYAVPVDIKLYIQNSANLYYADTITVRCRPDYLGMAGLQPAKVGGLYWAPVNVGAITTMGSATPNTNSGGYYFQWGRNKPFDITSTYATVASGSTNYQKITKGEDKDKFVTGSNWLNTNDPDYAFRNKQWSKDVDNSPCPKGWRVPIKDELEKIRIKSIVWNGGEYRYKIDGEEGIPLYLPCSGYRRYLDGSTTQYNGYTYFWASDMSGVNAWTMNNENGWRWTAYDTGYGWSIRCVQNTTPTP